VAAFRRPAAGDLAADVLPHAPPFLLLDRVLAIADGGGRFSKAIASDDPLVSASGTLAPLLVVEAMAQGAGIVLAYQDPELRARGSAVLAAIDHCTMYDAVRAGDLMTIEIGVVRRYRAMARIQGRAVVGDRRCLTATLTLAFAPHAAVDA
jgi:3-hydroxymyristoyl/3-hydroxydecanoyl-(acyl carrier protein) dehydratase